MNSFSLSACVEAFQKRAGISAAAAKHRLRKVKVEFLDIQPGEVRAKIALGRRKPAFIKMFCEVPRAEVLEKIETAMSRQAAWAASLAAGTLPEGAGDLFNRNGAALLPVSARELRFECAADPDEKEVLCEHSVLAGYLFLFELEKQPGLLLTFRGLPVQRLLERLKGAQTRKRPGGFPLAEVLEAEVSGQPDAGWQGTAAWARSRPRGETPWFEKMTPTGWLWKGKDVQAAFFEMIARARRAAAERLDRFEETDGRP